MVKRILITDDSSFIRTTLRDILTAGGYEVVGEADSGEQAIIKFQELLPDLVTLDVEMPVKTGLEALKGIMDLDRKAKVLMVTAEGQQATIVTAIQSGAKGFLVKPFKSDDVIAEVKRILGN